MKNNNGLPKNFKTFTQIEKVKTLLEMALRYPMEYKILPLGKLWEVDKEISNKIFIETENDQSENNYNFVIKKYLAD